MYNDSYPLVTVGTLCYNTGKYVIETMESVRRQQYPNVQHIIIDDCSSDDSVSILEEWMRANDYNCDFIKHEVNRGIHYGANEILSLAKGKYITFVSDDLWTDDKLNDQVKLISSYNGKAGMVYGDTMLFNDTGIITSSWYETLYGKDFTPPSGLVFKDIVNEFYFFLQAALIDMELLRRLNFKFDNDSISEDWELELAIARNAEVYGVNKVYHKYRRGVSNSITSNNFIDAKWHLVQKSHFRMFEKYYNHSFNTAEDNRTVLHKLRSVFWGLYRSKMSTYKERCFYAWRLFLLSRSYKDLLIFCGTVSYALPLGIYLYAGTKRKRANESIDLATV